MKKLFVLLATLLMLCFMSIDVMAAETLPIKKVNFCGVVEVEPNSTTSTVNVAKKGNTCKINVELIDDTYSLINFDNNEVEFTVEGENRQIIDVKDSNGIITRYNFIINYTNTSTGEDNPSTGDNKITYLVVALVSASIIGISYNRILKYSKVD